MRKILLMILLLISLPCIVIASENQGYLKHPEGMSLSDVYTEPSTTSQIIGQYYDGAKTNIVGENGDWLEVQIGEGMASLHGYVPKEYLVSEFPLTDQPFVPHFYEVRCENSAGAFVQPENSSATFGEYLNGTIVRAIGICGEWVHVEFGAFGTVFIQAEDLQPIDRKWIYLTGAEPIGFVEVFPRAEDGVSTRYFPDEDAPALEDEHFLSSYHSTLALVAELDGWCQVYRTANHTLGFISSENLIIHSFDDLFIDGDIALENGTFTCGQDMPEGLYEFCVDNGTRGIISISGTKTTHDRTHKVCGPSRYSLFIPHGADVSVSEGVLRNAKNEMIATESTPFTGNGRFLLGCQLPTSYEYNVEMLSASDNLPSAYCYSTFDGLYTTGYGWTSEPVMWPIPVAPLNAVSNRPGYFLEVENAIIKITDVN